MITRKLAKILRGKATPFQLFMACLLGSAISFTPFHWKAPGLTLVLLGLLVVLNANLAVAALSGILGKLLSLAIAPLCFSVGRFLIDGPTQGLFESMINAPVLALCGFEYYLTTGGFAVGILWGLFLGFLLVRTVSGFRRKMASLEEGSEAFQKWMSKKWVKALVWIFFGKGKGKATYEEVLSKKVGKPVRILGVLAVVGIAVLGFVFAQFFSDGIVLDKLKRGLEGANGATVDVAGVEVDIAKGRLVVTGLAMADPDHLERDAFRTERLEADIDVGKLLRKRVQIDKIRIGSASQGEKRATPGKLLRKEEEKKEEKKEPPVDLADAKKLDEYLKDAEKWKERLGQAKEWIDKLSGPEEEEEEDAIPQGEEISEEKLEAILQRQIERDGYARVVASHLIEKAPLVVITDLVVDSVGATFLEEETLAIQGQHLSTHPGRLENGPGITAKSSKETFSAEIILTGASASGGESRAKGFYKGIPVDSFADQLSVQGTQPIAGGTMDVELTGHWPSSGTDDLTLEVAATLHDTTVTIPQGGSAKVSELLVPIEVKGPLTDPSIRVDTGKLADALVKAGAAQLADEVRAKAGEVVDEALEAAKKEAEEKLLKAAEEKLGDEVGKQVGEQIEKGVGEEAKKKAKGLFDDVFGGKKK